MSICACIRVCACGGVHGCVGVHMCVCVCARWCAHVWGSVYIRVYELIGVCMCVHKCGEWRNRGLLLVSFVTPHLIF